MKPAKYTEQMPFVGTPLQKQLILAESKDERISQADVVRRAVDRYYGLVDGEYPPEKSKDAERSAAF